MRYFKAFHPGMICNGKQYAENTVYEEDGDTICKKGVMHFCETPLDCLDYYPLIDEDGRVTEFAEVEPLDKVLEVENKRACRKLRIGAKLSLKDFINAQVSIQMEKGACDTADSGNWSHLAASGDWSKLAASGDESQLAASGDWSKLAASGDESKLAALGNESKLAALGAHSIAAAIGRNSTVSASLGSWIVLAEFNICGEPICVKAAQIDGEKLKPNVFYKLKGGEFVEANG